MQVETNALVAQHIHNDADEATLSWGAIFAGAVAAAALSLILLALGFGLGLSAISPWSYQGASGSTLAAGAVIWLLVTSLCASGLGGYIAGRMRAKWELATESEAHFRDTAHGFLAWAVATLISAAVLSSAASSMVGTAATIGAGAAATGSAASMASTPGAAADGQPLGDYFVDMMLRSGKPTDPGANTSGTQREVRSILAASITSDMSAGDKAYLTQLVANRTGLSATEAEQRVSQVATAAKLAADAAVVKAKEKAEIARKTAVHTAMWIFISLLVGAFYASLAATWGGKQRDPQSYLRRVA